MKYAYRSIHVVACDNGFVLAEFLGDKEQSREVYRRPCDALKRLRGWLEWAKENPAQMEWPE